MASFQGLARGVLLYLIVPLIAIAAVFLFADDFILPQVTRHGDEFALPKFVGMTEMEADDAAAKANINLEVAGREFSADRPEGVILTQTPEAGSMVKAGRNVKLVISAGTRMGTIPNVFGLPLAQANLALQKAGFETGEIFWMTVDSLPKNTAIETIPSQGTMLPAGSKVSLAVNKGEVQNIVLMPSLLGLPLETARERIEDAGLVVGDIKRVKDNRYLPGTVLEQDPKFNSQVFRGDLVKLTVSKTD